LRFDAAQFAAFELFLLKRPGARQDYSQQQIKDAEAALAKLSEEERELLVKNIIAGLPGAEEGYSLEEFQTVLDQYAQIGAKELRANLYSFLKEIIPAAEAAGVMMAIHPDDPPFPILGLPRVVSTEADAKELLAAVDSKYNGLCFCTGSYGVIAENDLPGMVERLGDRINFIHLRSTRRDSKGNFHEADHLDGDVDMFAVMGALVQAQHKRIASGRADHRLPMRPAHGHRMLGDGTRKTTPRDSASGRLRGLAAPRGLELGIRRSQDLWPRTTGLMASREYVRWGILGCGDVAETKSGP